MTLMASRSEDISPLGWQAQLRIRFEKRYQRTVLRRTHQHGPLTIQKPFYPEGDTCHTYLLHPPGGIVGGDSLKIEASVTPNATALVTTPAANKVYRTTGYESCVSQNLRVADGAQMEG